VQPVKGRISACFFLVLEDPKLTLLTTVGCVPLVAPVSKRLYRVVGCTVFGAVLLNANGH